MTPRTCIFLAAVLGLLAVGLGAFGAHGLTDNNGTGFLEKKYADTEAKFVGGLSVPASYKYLLDYKTAVEYQMWHALSLGMVGLLMLRQRSRMLTVAAFCFAGGIFFFSGSLYILVILGPRWQGIPWGAITPIGGTLMLTGWIALALCALKLSGLRDQS